MILKITNSARDYAWGSHTLIPEYFGVQPTGRPMAEVWLGTHPGSPSKLADSPDHTLIEQLGGRQLPYLLKVLAADLPLSLQAHPNAEQAKAGFARESAAGIPINSPLRNYKDDRPKPEMLVALSDPFEALCGFAEVETIAANFDLLEKHANDELKSAIAEWRLMLSESEGLHRLYNLLMRSDHTRIERLTEAAAHAAGEMVTNGHNSHPSIDLLIRLQSLYPGDPGILVSLLMNYVSLRPGEAIALNAGSIHAYMYGLGVEVMASSDNVLRGGLTPKHIDINELEHVLDFHSEAPPLVAPRELVKGLWMYPSNVDDFILYRAELSGANVLADLELPTDTIILVTAGEIAVSNSLGQREVLRRSEAAFVAADAKTFTLAGSGTAFIAMSAGNQSSFGN